MILSVAATLSEGSKYVCVNVHAHKLHARAQARTHAQVLSRHKYTQPCRRSETHQYTDIQIYRQADRQPQPQTKTRTQRRRHTSHGARDIQPEKKDRGEGKELHDVHKEEAETAYSVQRC